MILDSDSIMYLSIHFFFAFALQSVVVLPSKSRANLEVGFSRDTIVVMENEEEKLVFSTENGQVCFFM